MSLPKTFAAASINALLAVLVTAIGVVGLVALAPVTEGQHPTWAVLRFGLAGVLLAIAVPLKTSLGTISLAPLGVTLFAAWRAMRAGVHTTRAAGARDSREPKRAFQVGLLVGIAYALLTALAAALVDGEVIGVAPGRAALHGLVFGTAAGTLGAIRATSAMRAIAVRVPRVIRDATRTGTVAALLMLAAGAAATGLATAVNGGDAADILHSAYHTGVAGQGGLTLVNLLIGPNLAVWATAYLIGPGFAVGTGTIIRASGVATGAVPALPAFAAIPHSALSTAAMLLLGTPVVAGACAGWLMARRRLRPRTAAKSAATVAAWGHLLTGAVLAGPVAGVLLGLAAAVSGGALGDNRLAAIGPSPLPVALISSGVITFGCLLGALGTRALYRPVPTE